MRERELKQQHPRERGKTAKVAPHAGARIETITYKLFACQRWSLPMRERELKQDIQDFAH